MRADLIKVRRAGERHHVRSGGQNMWLTFFPERLSEPLAEGFGCLAALNESVLPPEGSMLVYPRRGSETITYVIEGTLSHRDGGGHPARLLHTRDFQWSRVNFCDPASYTNASSNRPLHVVQLSLLGGVASPGGRRVPEQRSFPVAQGIDELRLVGSSDGRLGSLQLNQDARVFSGMFTAEHEQAYTLDEGRLLWLQVVRGKVSLGALSLGAGDGAGVAQVGELRLTARTAAEIVLIDVAEAQPRRAVRPDGFCAPQHESFVSRVAARG